MGDRNGKLTIGNIICALDREFLKSQGVNTMISITQYGSGTQYYPDLITYRCAKISDREYYRAQLGAILEELTEFLETRLQAGDHVYIHCNQGKSRSGTLLVAYLMRYQSMNYDEAMSYVRQDCGRAIAPNTGFVEELRKFGDKHFKKNVGNSSKQHWACS